MNDYVKADIDELEAYKQVLKQFINNVVSSSEVFIGVAKNVCWNDKVLEATTNVYNDITKSLNNLLPAIAGSIEALEDLIWHLDGYLKVYNSLK